MLLLCFSIQNWSSCTQDCSSTGQIFWGFLGTPNCSYQSHNLLYFGYGILGWRYFGHGDCKKCFISALEELNRADETNPVCRVCTTVSCFLVYSTSAFSMVKQRGNSDAQGLSLTVGIKPFIALGERALGISQGIM